MQKRKILFYGNCQVGVLANFFKKNLSDIFDVQSCVDCGLIPFSGTEHLFAIWTQPNKERQAEYKDCIISKLRETDVFIFQRHERPSVKELTTEYLHDNVAKGLKICVPDTRFFAHLTDDRVLGPYIRYIKSKISDPQQIIHYIQTSDDPHLTELLKQEYPFNKEFRMYFNENSQRLKETTQRYDIAVDMCTFMEKEFQNRILAFSHNHPTECYFIELLTKIYELLDIKISDYPIIDLVVPKYKSLDPRQFKFFTETFPNINYENFIGRHLTVDDVVALLK